MNLLASNENLKLQIKHLTLEGFEKVNELSQTEVDKNKHEGKSSLMASIQTTRRSNDHVNTNEGFFQNINFNTTNDLFDLDLSVIDLNLTNEQLCEASFHNLPNTKNSPNDGHFFDLLIKEHMPLQINESFDPSKIFQEIAEKIPELLVNKFGSQFCTYLYDHLSKKEKIKFLKVLKFSFTSIALDTLGYQSLIFIIEKLKTDEEFETLIDNVKNKITIANLIKFENSNLVLERIIKHVPTKHLSCLFEFVHSKIEMISIGHSTVNIINELLLKANQNSTEMNRLLKAIAKKFHILVYHSVGHKIIINLIDSLEEMQILKITKQFSGNFCKMASNKYSACVLAKAFEKLNVVNKFNF